MHSWGGSRDARTQRNFRCLAGEVQLRGISGTQLGQRRGALVQTHRNLRYTSVEENRCKLRGSSGALLGRDAEVQHSEGSQVHTCSWGGIRIANLERSQVHSWGGLRGVNSKGSELHSWGGSRDVRTQGNFRCLAGEGSEVQTQRDLRYIAGMGSEVQTQQRDLLRYIAREASKVQTQRDLRGIAGEGSEVQTQGISGA